MWVLLVLLLFPCSVGAFSPPVILPLDDEPEIVIDATGLDIATGTISQDVVIQNPRGKLYNRQILRVELSSNLPHKVRWGTKFQPKHAFKLPTATSGKGQIDLWSFEYISELRIWSLIATTTPLEAK